MGESKSDAAPQARWKRPPEAIDEIVGGPSPELLEAAAARGARSE